MMVVRNIKMTMEEKYGYEIDKGNLVST